jgi:ribosome-associated translation inhibitor RaiA
MRLHIRTHGIEVDQATRDYALRQAHTALGRFAPRLGDVNVKIEDDNGPRGGNDDKICRIRAAVTGRREVVIEARHAHVHAAVDEALERAAQAVARELSRTQAA